MCVALEACEDDSLFANDTNIPEKSFESGERSISSWMHLRHSSGWEWNDERVRLKCLESELPYSEDKVLMPCYSEQLFVAGTTSLSGYHYLPAI